MEGMTFAEGLARADAAERKLDFWRANGAKAGRASVAARDPVVLREHMRRIAPIGGSARMAMMSAEDRRCLCAAGGKAGWEKLTPEQAHAKRVMGGEAARRVISHERRVEIGRMGATVRWARARAA